MLNSRLNYLLMCVILTVGCEAPVEEDVTTEKPQPVCVDCAGNVAPQQDVAQESLVPIPDPFANATFQPPSSDNCGCGAMSPPAAWRFTITGAVANPAHLGKSERDRAVLCPQLNGAYTLTRNPGGWWRKDIYPDCIWTSTETITGICKNTPAIAEKWALFKRGEIWYLESVQYCNVIRYTCPASTFNCGGPNTFTNWGLNFCVGIPNTITVTPQ